MSSPPLVVPKAPSCRHCVMLMRGRLIGWVSSNCLERPVQGEPSPKPLLQPSPHRLHPEPVLSPGMPWWEVLVPAFQESAWPSRGAHAHHLPSFQAPRDSSFYFFFCLRRNFCIPASLPPTPAPRSQGPEAAPNLGAVPWQRRFESQPDFCSCARFASSPSHPWGRGASPLFSHSFRPSDPSSSGSPQALLPPSSARYPSSALSDPRCPPPSLVGCCPPLKEEWLIWRAKCPLCLPGTDFGICCQGTKAGKMMTGEWLGAVFQEYCLEGDKTGEMQGGWRERYGKEH